VWRYEPDDDKSRPVLVVTRSEAVPVLTSIVVAPVTRTIRGIPTEIFLSEIEGLTEDCAASFDNLRTVRRAFLSARLGRLGPDASQSICNALAALADC
jgi:mRNA interferase MazF